MRERRSKVAIGDMLLPFQRPTQLQNENPRWKGGKIVGFFSGQQALLKLIFHDLEQRTLLCRGFLRKQL